MCFLGQTTVYAEASEICSQVLSIEVSAPQIQRLCNHYGGQIDKLVKSNCEGAIPNLEPTKKGDPTYVMIDGSMLFTRESKWKEIKLGRVFNGSKVVDIQDNRREITKSLYVSHLGSVNEFFPKFERYLVPYKNKIIIGDGAKWIWNWAEDNFPGAVQILDFFHAKEKLVLYSKHQYKDDVKRKEWLDTQLAYLRNNEGLKVIDIVRKNKSRNIEAKEAKLKLINYFEEHEDRMQYKTYRDKGYLIGSGPIEAAHRNVIQQRMKLSGQKWSIDGVQAIANLRCYNKSGAWKIIENLISAA